MHISMRQEQFSKAMVRAIAAVAGYNICTYDVDDDSIDLGLVGNRRIGVDIRSPKLDLQLKCTMTDDGAGHSLPFDLSIKNYDDLRDPDVHTSRILVVVCTPDDVPEWLHEQPRQQRCADAHTGSRCAGNPRRQTPPPSESTFLVPKGSPWLH